MFRRGSRYVELEQVEWVSPTGRTVAFVSRRFIADKPTVTESARHTVTEGDRLDNVTARYLGGPEQFWRVCDANRAMRPSELTEEIGRVLIIPTTDAEGWSR